MSDEPQMAIQWGGEESSLTICIIASAFQILETEPAAITINPHTVET